MFVNFHRYLGKRADLQKDLLRFCLIEFAFPQDLFEEVTVVHELNDLRKWLRLCPSSPRDASRDTKLCGHLRRYVCKLSLLLQVALLSPRPVMFFAATDNQLASLELN